MPVVLDVLAVVLVAALAVAGVRLGATRRGLCALVVASGLGLLGRAERVEEYVLMAAAIAVLLAVGPLTLWRRADAAGRSLRIEVRTSARQVSASAAATLSVTVVNVGTRTVGGGRLQSPDTEVWRRSLPGLRAVAPTGPLAVAGAPSPPWRAWRSAVARSLAVPSLSPGESATFESPIPTSERGVLSLPGLRLWCEDPYRLFAHPVGQAPAATVVVTPTPLTPGDVPLGASPARGVEGAPTATPDAAGGAGVDLAGLRPYVPGDRLRLLHWPTLARTGALIVRHFEGAARP